MKKFEWIDHPADTGFRAYGRDIIEAFENAALALTNIIGDTDSIEEKEEVSVEIEAEDLEALLYDWLDNLLYLQGARGLVGGRFEVEKLSKINDGYELRAKLYGEKYDPSKHGPGTEVKAMTYHMMEIDQQPEQCSIQVVVDT